LNTIMAEQLVKFRDDVEKLIAKKIEKDEAILLVLKKYIVESKIIRFEGNGYGEEWKKEAKKRGLNNIATTPSALEAYTTKKTLHLFEHMNILSHREQEARYEIALETYTKKIQIESRIIGDIVTNQIVPAAIQYQKMLVDNVAGMKTFMSASDFKKTTDAQIEMIKEISEHIAVINGDTYKMIEERKKANNLDSPKKNAHAYCDKIKP